MVVKLTIGLTTASLFDLARQTLVQRI